MRKGKEHNKQESKQLKTATNKRIKTKWKYKTKTKQKQKQQQQQQQQQSKTKEKKLAWQFWLTYDFVLQNNTPFLYENDA